MTADELKAKIDLEGDRKDFTYKEHECRVLRMPITGHLCGYVGVCTSSSLHGIDYGSLDSVEVHGGLTSVSYTHLDVYKRQSLSYVSMILCEQLRTIDKKRLGQWICTLDDKTIEKINKAIRVSLAL